MTDYIVPFGKHQGKPLEVLINDKKYLQWVLTDCDIYIHYPEIYKEIIQRLVNPKNKSQTYQNPKDYYTDSPITINPIIERNRLIGSYIDSSINWRKFASDYYGHNQQGDIMNLRFFANGIPVQFDYTNANVEEFGDKHFFVQILKELPEDFESILQFLINLKSDNNHEVTLIVDRVNILGFTKEQIFKIFDSNNIDLSIRNPYLTTFTTGTNASSDAKDDIPF